MYKYVDVGDVDETNMEVGSKVKSQFALSASMTRLNFFCACCFSYILYRTVESKIRRPSDKSTFCRDTNILARQQFVRKLSLSRYRISCSQNGHEWYSEKLLKSTDSKNCYKAFWINFKWEIRADVWAYTPVRFVNLLVFFLNDTT